jgi:hypothetical protein
LANCQMGVFCKRICKRLESDGSDTAAEMRWTGDRP